MEEHRAADSSEDTTASPAKNSGQPRTDLSDTLLKDTSVRDLPDSTQTKTHHPPLTEDVQETETLDTSLTESLDEQKAFGDSDVARVDEQTVEKLTYSVLAHHLPSLQKAQSSIHSLTENQRILIETIQQENTKFSECQSLKDFTETMEKAKLYHNKLINIRKEMLAIHDKATGIKKRAIKLQQHKQREALQREQDREKQLERERRLVAKPAKK